MTDLCSDAFNSQSNISVSFLVDRPELESGISRFVAERLIQFGQRSLLIQFLKYNKVTVFFNFINNFCSNKIQVCIKNLINVLN